MTATDVALAVYLAGTVVALLKADAGWGMRVLLAVVWPLAPLAFAVTVAALVAVGMVAFPIVGVAMVALTGAAWYLL